MRSIIRSLPLRRAFHTFPARPVASASRGGLGLALGASGLVAGYVGWRISSTENRLHFEEARQKPIKSQVVAEHKPKVHEATSSSAPSPPTPASEFVPDTPSSELVDGSVPPAAGAPEGATEAEDSKDAAFDPVTGEINWDCPCLGGMAHGPCGPQFREAFACFIYSEQEPKGIDCVEKFRAMQDCFREHPDVYGEEIADDDDNTAAATVDVALDEKEVSPSLSSENAALPVQTSTETTGTSVLAAEPESKPKRKPRAQAQKASDTA